jgi:hypothetical protein
MDLLNTVPSQMMSNQRRVAAPIWVRHFREQRITVYELAA